MTGMQTAVTGFSTSIIGGITYSNENGFGYSYETVSAGMNNMFANTVTSMASSFTTASLNYTNAGEKLLGFSDANIKNVGAFNGLIGSLAGQAANYALGGDFTLNLFNINMLTGDDRALGLLELRFGREETSMGLGTGGADVSFGTLASALKGLAVLGVNSRINGYVKNNDEIHDAEFLRLQYGYGDDRQVSQLWDILKGDTLLRVSDGDYGDLKARTTIDENGNRVVTIGGYQTGMRIEEIFRLGNILGHEAYRNGYSVGDIDASGNLVTTALNSAELSNASIARIAMGDRINAEHDWFYNYNLDFAFESYLLKDANKTGNFSMFNDYMQTFYENDEDYFFQRTSTRGQYQNQERYRNILLFNADAEDVINAENALKRTAAYEAYVADQEKKEETPLDFDSFINDRNINKDYYNPLDVITLRNHGCRFMSTLYGLEAITGSRHDPQQLHDLVRRQGFFTDKSSLSNDDIVNILSYYSSVAYFTASVEFSGSPNEEQLFALEESQNMYLAILKVKGASGGPHFVALDRIDFILDDNRNVTGISNVHVSNPWDDIRSTTGNQSYTMEQIYRWDIFRITPVNTR